MWAKWPSETGAEPAGGEAAQAGPCAKGPGEVGMPTCMLAPGGQASGRAIHSINTPRMLYPG